MAIQRVLRLCFIFFAVLFEVFLAGAASFYVPVQSVSFLLIALAAGISIVVIIVRAAGSQEKNTLS